MRSDRGNRGRLAQAHLDLAKIKQNNYIMLYGEGDPSGAAGAGRASVAVHAVRACRGGGIPSADAGGVAAQSGSVGRNRTDRGTQVPPLRTAMRRKDARKVSWVARFGRLQTRVTRYRCAPCSVQCRTLLDWFGGPGRISGSLAFAAYLRVSTEEQRERQS